MFDDILGNYDDENENENENNPNLKTIGDIKKDIKNILSNHLFEKINFKRLHLIRSDVERYLDDETDISRYTIHVSTSGTTLEVTINYRNINIYIKMFRQ